MAIMKNKGSSKPRSNAMATVLLVALQSFFATACGGRVSSETDDRYYPPPWVSWIPATEVMCYGSLHPPVCNDGTPYMRVLEAASPGTGLNCAMEGRGEASIAAWRPIVLENEAILGRCGTTGTPDCSNMVVCEVLPVPDGVESDCLNSVEVEGEAGFCVFSIRVDLNGNGIRECDPGAETDCVGSREVQDALGCAESSGMVRMVGTIPVPGSSLYQALLYPSLECGEDGY